ncbi:hypothetical protein GCM10028807_33850 [Spirosoma daeguense]
MQTFQEAQSDMREGYANGSLGIIVSGFIWLISGLVALYLSPKQAIGVLFFGGMLIHPLSLVVGKLLGIRGSHTKDNPLGTLAITSTIIMIMCIPLAYILSFQRVEWFFQAMLVIIGGRYLLFTTLYGLSFYWILGALLGVAGYALFSLKADAAVSVLAGSFIEISLGLYLFMVTSRNTTQSEG